MTRLTTITWKSITVLPLLIGISVAAALLIALRKDLPLVLGMGLVVGIIAAAEIAYLGLLMLVNRHKSGGAASVAARR